MRNAYKVWGTVAFGSLALVNCSIGDLQDSPAATGAAGNTEQTNAGSTTGPSDQGSSSSKPTSTAGDSGSANGGTGPSDPTGVAGGKGPSNLGGAGAAEGGAAGSGTSSPGGESGAAGNGETCAADTQTDPKNCGSCGHSCLGGECHAAVCAPFVLANGQPDIQGLIADAKFVYWANFAGQHATGNGQVMKAPLTGGSPTTLASAQVNPAGVWVDQDSAYFSNVACCSSTIMKASLAGAGGSPTPIATGQAGPQGSVLFQGSLFWPNHVVNGQIMTVATNNGTATPLASGVDRPTSVSVDGTNVYWTEDSGAIRKVSRAGGTVTPLVTGENGPTLLNATAKYLFWINNTSMMRAPLSGGTATPFEPNEGRGEILVDTQNIYWDSAGGIKSAPFAGGTPQTLVTAKEMGGAGLFFIEPQSVIWADSTSGCIMRKAR